MFAAATMASALSLSACGTEPEAPVEEVAGTIPGMSIENARMVLNAVEGNPAAVYFDLKYDADRGLSIRRADVAQAGSATLHDYGEYDFKVQMMEALPIPLTNGAEVAFKPGGLHVMAFDPSSELKPGGKAEITLTVSGGQTHKFEAEVLAAGDPRATAAGDGG
ncbi:copper chaperone PCu(A)C [Erythrobacter sp. WH158]|uniref:Copper chaperone PCu(A)C n=2 Tax=Erythrobacter crassostreae TaxID=2828328 RepID=A0A9X1F4J1_9SPHN|nr:copper chaperone PCu(A)C [Erythrobacter crassostrea]